VAKASEGRRRRQGTLSKAAALANQLNDELGINVRLGNDPYFEIVRIPTGSLVLDRITGGGFALGRHVELYGDEHVGKSYVALKTMALAQQRGKICALVDPEHAFDPEWFAYMGGIPDELLTFHPTKAEDAVAVMMLLAKHAENEDVEVITVDSVTSLVPLEETDKDPREEPRIAGQARMMSRALRRITTVNHKTLFIWINQLRTDVGLKFGNPNVTTGGKALRYYATTRVSMHRGTQVRTPRLKAVGGKLQKKEVQTGRWVQCRVEKDKSTTPYGEGSFLFNNDLGRIDDAYEILQLALEDEIVEWTGKMVRYVDLEDREWRGYERKFIDYLRNEEDLRNEILAEVRDNTIRLARLGDGEADDQEV
jgi:recombination protein RecA